MLFLRSKRAVVPLVLLLFVLLAAAILWLPYGQWGFIIDDFGLVWHSKVSSLASLVNFFTQEGLHTFFQPANYIAPQQTFFVVLYRPMLYVFYALQYLLFGFSPYGFLCMSAFLHALNAWLLFIILRSYVQPLASLLGAGYFLFHLSMLHWFGWVTGQQHLIALFFLLTGFIFYKKFEQTNHVRWLFFVSVSFCASIFTRETALIVPMWLVFGMLWYWEYVHRKTLLLFFTWIPFLGYLSWRMVRFPLKSSGSDLTWVTQGFRGFFSFLKNQFLNYVTWIVDLVNLGFMGGGNRLRKGFFIVLGVSFFVFLFFKSSRKKDVLFLLLSSIMFAWPAVVRFYTSRFMYEALPFFILAIVLLFFENNFVFKRKSLCFFALIIFNAAVFPKILLERQKSHVVIDQSFKELIPQLQGCKGVCFVGLPFWAFCTGTAQACYMYGLSPDVPVYYDKQTFVWDERWLYTQPRFQVREDGNCGFQINLEKPTNFAFYDRGTSLGEKNFEEDQESFTLRWSLVGLQFKPPTAFVTWDYGQKRFKILKLLHSHQNDVELFL